MRCSLMIRGITFQESGEREPIMRVSPQFTEHPSFSPVYGAPPRDPANNAASLTTPSTLLAPTGALYTMILKSSFCDFHSDQCPHPVHFAFTFPPRKERKLFVIQNMEQSLSVIQKLKLPPISMIIFIPMILFPITAHLTFIATKVAANALIWWSHNIFYSEEHHNHQTGSRFFIIMAIVASKQPPNTLW